MNLFNINLFLDKSLNIEYKLNNIYIINNYQQYFFVDSMQKLSKPLCMSSLTEQYNNKMQNKFYLISCLILLLYSGICLLAIKKNYLSYSIVAVLLFGLFPVICSINIIKL